MPPQTCSIFIGTPSIFKYGRPEESCSGFTMMYFDKRMASRINFVLKGLNFSDDRVRCGYSRKRAVF